MNYFIYTSHRQFLFHLQAKLEKLLQIYPQEEVESKRWEKIAAALGNRTLKQVLFCYILRCL